MEVKGYKQFKLMERLKFVIGPVMLVTVFLGCAQEKPGHHSLVQEKKIEHQKKTSSNYALQDLKAYNLATDLVLEKLQEPMTAEFPSTQERLAHIDKLGDKKYRIDSWVDSQDTYGAMTRKRFSLTFRLDHSRIIKEEFEIEENGKIPKVKYHRKNRE